MGTALDETKYGRVEVAPVLPVGVYSLCFSRSGAGRLPDYAGSAWRGAFGQALRKSVCVTRQPTCEGCVLRTSCAYSYVFETPPPPRSEKMRRYTAAPHPFVIALPPESAGAADYAIGLTLFGNGNRFLPYFIHAWQRAGREGIGSQRATFELDTVAQFDFVGRDWRDIYSNNGDLIAYPPFSPIFPAMPDAIRVELLTPLRLKRNEHYVSAQQFRFADLFRNMLRRISMLTYFHTDAPLETDFASLVHRSDAVEISNVNVKWHDWTRYSSRQKTTIKMGGLVGSFDVSMAGFEALWPYLWLGAIAHAGKGTCMGLGQYKIGEPTSLPTVTNA